MTAERRAAQDETRLHAPGKGKYMMDELDHYSWLCGLWRWNSCKSKLLAVVFMIPLCVDNEYTRRPQSSPPLGASILLNNNEGRATKKRQQQHAGIKQLKRHAPC